MIINPVIIGSGSYVPDVVVKNSDFLETEFLDENGKPFPYDNKTIIDKFSAITGIQERRYARPDQVNSDLAYEAALKAIEDAGVDKESLDYIILAQNFGNIKPGVHYEDQVPSLSARVKHGLGIENPLCQAFDVAFGCPGWILGVQQAEALIRSGMAKRVLVIGSEALSRVVDPYDRDLMIYADGAGAVVLEAQEAEVRTGVLATHGASFTKDEAYYLFAGESFSEKNKENTLYLKMNGHKIYEFALKNVPVAMKAALDKSGKSIDDVKKILIHQANEKMDAGIVKRFYRLFGMKMPVGIMPMVIENLGNSSVATIPTLFDLIRKGKLDEHGFEKGDVLLFASIGAGMHVNAFVYEY